MKTEIMYKKSGVIEICRYKIQCYLCDVQVIQKNKEIVEILVLTNHTV